MSHFANHLHHLADQVGTGDSGAALALRQELQPHMLRIVRRALRSTAGSSTLTQRIQAAIHRLSPDHPEQPAAEAEKLVHRVAHDICESLIGRLQTAHPAHRPMRETVRN